MEDDDYQRLRDYSLRLLSFRPRSVKEISDKLKKFAQKRNFPDRFVEKILVELKNQRFLDDKEFARWWIGQRQSYKPKGKKAIITELLQKGIPKEIIEEAVASGGENNEYELAMRVIDKKLSHLKHLPSEKLKIKIRDLLLRRGFDWETIYKVIDGFGQKR